MTNKPDETVEESWTEETALRGLSEIRDPDAAVVDCNKPHVEIVCSLESWSRTIHYAGLLLTSAWEDALRERDEINRLVFEGLMGWSMTTAIKAMGDHEAALALVSCHSSNVG